MRPFAYGPSGRGEISGMDNPDVVFTADFTSTRQWVAGRSSAYPDGGPVNPADNKLDYLVPDASYSRTGVFRAVRRPDGLWNTGLLTTEGSQDGFQVRTGDELEARVRLPVETVVELLETMLAGVIAQTANKLRQGSSIHAPDPELLADFFLGGVVGPVAPTS